MSELIKVEIFRDAQASSSMDTSIARAGLKKVADQIGYQPFEIIRNTRNFRLLQHPSNSIDSSRVAWPALEADYSIILTDRRLLPTDDRSETYGMTWPLPHQSPIKGVAIVKTDVIQSELVAAHEIGHLMQLNYGNRNELMEAHCGNPKCLMVGRRKIDQHTQRSVAQTFCSSCERQLSRRASFVLRHLRGEAAPYSVR
jgi:hypothetical protein